MKISNLIQFLELMSALWLTLLLANRGRQQSYKAFLHLLQDGAKRPDHSKVNLVEKPCSYTFHSRSQKQTETRDA